MNPWDPNIYTVTPAAKILARCVAAGTMTQVNNTLVFVTFVSGCNK